MTLKRISRPMTTDPPQTDTPQTDRQQIRFHHAADQGLTVEFGNVISPEINEHVLALEQNLATHPIVGITETVPSYRSLLILYDNTQTSAAELRTGIESRLPQAGLGQTSPPLANPHQASQPRRTSARRWRIPVLYGPPFGLDLEAIAKTHGLTTEEVIRLHAAPEYRVYMLGFMPGYAYLGGLDQKLHTPRRADPRPKTPAGGIAIGGTQTSIGSLEAPGGWHFLGRTPIHLFDPARGRSPFLLSPGDTVLFTPITEPEFLKLLALSDQGEIPADYEVL